MAELKIIGMDEVAVEEIEWLWYPYIKAHYHTRRPGRR